jgi:prepilin-type N-terminal cleavage/methylation domain-containing protein/prepilin-type processing-associated H-X9-DG protein
MKIQSIRAFSLVELLVTMTVIAILSSLLLPAVRSAKEAGNSAKCLSNLRQLYLANCLYAESHNGFFVLAAEDIFSVNSLKRWHGQRTSTSTPFDPSKSPLAPYLGLDGKIKICPSFRNPYQGFDQGTGGYGYNEVYVGGRGDLYDFTWDANSATHSLSQNDPKAWALSLVVMFADAAFPQPQGIIEYSFIEPPYWESPPGTVTATPPDPTVHFRHNGHANVIWCDGHASAEQMSSTVPFNVYGGDNNKYKVGWFGPRNDNACWKSE